MIGTRKLILSEIARELALRRNVYPRWIANKKLKRDEANKRVALLQCAYDYIQQHMRENDLLEYTGEPFGPSSLVDYADKDEE